MNNVDLNIKALLTKPTLKEVIRIKKEKLFVHTFGFYRQRTIQHLQKRSVPDLHVRNRFTSMSTHETFSLQSKKQISGEISKEPFLDILLTNLEQSSFSLMFKTRFFENEELLRKEVTSPRLKTSNCLFSRTEPILPKKSFARTRAPSHGGGKNFQQLKIVKDQNHIQNALQHRLESKPRLQIPHNHDLLHEVEGEPFNGPISCSLKIGDYVNCGDKIGYSFETPVIITESGKILRISQTQITIQKIQPVLFYSQAEIHVESNEWVKRGTPILTLTHQTLVTGDIVQGIPRIEQLFEASTAAPPGAALQDFGSPSDDDSSKKSSIDDYLRSYHTSHLLPPTSSFTRARNQGVSEQYLKSTLQNKQNSGQINDNSSEKRYDSTVHSATEDKPMFLYKTLQSQVRETFRKKWDQVPLPVAVRQSLEEIQQIIVESIQKVYISQGVLIADKHIEIIVRQMTSKAQVFDGGSTGLLIDEILSVQQIENANISTPGQKALYLPVVMGLTRSALSSDSFVSAASFQETTRVLSRDAVAGKTDFLRGLKEKVIIGDLIDAGTGLDVFYIYSLFSKKIFENKLRDILNRKVTHKTLKKLVLTVPKSQQNHT